MKFISACVCTIGLLVIVFVLTNIAPMFGDSMAFLAQL